MVPNIDVNQLEQMYSHFDDLRTKYFNAKYCFFIALEQAADFDFLEWLILYEGCTKFDLETYLTYGDNLGRDKPLSWAEFVDLLPDDVKSKLKGM